MSRIFLDVTDLAIYLRHNSGVSGIQRVLINVARMMAETQSDVFISFVDPTTKAYRAVSAKSLDDINGFEEAILKQLFFIKGRASKALATKKLPTLEKYRPGSAKYYYRFACAVWASFRGKDDYFRRRGTSLSAWRTALKTGPSDTKGVSIPASVDPLNTAEPGDTLVILGASWNISRLDAYARQLREKHVRLVVLLHDLVPLLTPEHVEDRVAKNFRLWLEDTVSQADMILATTEFTAAKLRDYLASHDSEAKVEVLPLARCFEPSVTDETAKDRVDLLSPIDRRIAGLITRPYVLCVGTMESRKNNLSLAQAWHRLSLRPEIDLPRLIFAGKRGWLNDDFFELMDRTSGLGGWAKIVEGPSDAELALLYEHCLFTTMVSFHEGWGLPIGEGFTYGKTAVIAKNSAMPEVGGELVEYCDAQSVSSIAAACERLISDHDHRGALEDKIAAAKLRSWSDVAEDLTALLQNKL
ncbi:MAG: glycosyltransferase family 1 protein [Pseudomonadota bacterium]